MDWVTVALGALVGLASVIFRARKKTAHPPPESGAWRRLAPPTRPSTDDIVDAPRAFGYRACWLAFPAAEPDAVAAALELEHAFPSNWQRGLRIAYDRDDVVFVTPPVRGHVLAVGRGLPSFGGESHGNGDLLMFLRDLGKLLPTFFYFGTHRIVEYQAWSMIKDGAVIRAYGYLGEGMETLIDFGEPTSEEVGQGLCFPASSGQAAEEENPSSPGEEDVMRLAGAWSVDPTSLENEPTSTRLGIVGVRR